MPSAMANARVGGQAVFVLEHALGDLRDFDEVHGAGFGEDGSQFACGVAQEREAGADDLPVFFGVAGWEEDCERRARADFEASDWLRVGESARAGAAFQTLRSAGNPWVLLTCWRKVPSL